VKFTKFTMSQTSEPQIAARRQSQQSCALGARCAALAELADVRISFANPSHRLRWWAE